MIIRNINSSEGSLITAAAVSAGVLSIVVAGYLSYMSNEYNLNYRSHRWTQSLHLAESAVEIGFAEFNFQHSKGGNGFSADRGWTNVSGGKYTKTVTGLTDAYGQTIGDVTITVESVGATNPRILGEGVVNGALFGNSTHERGVRATIKKSSRFPVGLMAKDTIDLNGNNIAIDSYDSNDPTKSTAGQYDPLKKQPNGDMATLSTVVDSLSVGQADIYGRLWTGPGGMPTLGNNGSIGPTFVNADRADDVADGIANGWIQNDFDVDVPDTELPAGADSWPAPSAGSSINTDAVIEAGDWKLSSLALAATENLLITNGTVRIYVTGNTSVSGNATITIAGNASLEIYAGGSMYISGGGVINNTGDPTNNQFYGLPTSLNWYINGNGQWVGNVYAPNAALTLNGGGVSGHMSGAAVSKTITLNGGTNFHYDEDLASSDTGAGYVIVSWEVFRKDGNGVWVAE